MVYNYSQEANERFAEAYKYQNTDMKRALEGYLKIIEDFKEDKGVLAKAYYYAATIYVMLSEGEKAEECCTKSIECGKESGNIRCQVLSMTQLTVLKLNNMNDALAANYVYEALSLAIQNKDDDLIHTMYTLLAQIFESVEDYETSIQYHRKGAEEFAKQYPDAKTTYVTTYGGRILCTSICCIFLGYVEEFEKNYNELLRIGFGDSLPVYHAAMIFMKGYLAYMKNQKEEAEAVLLEFMETLQQVEEIMDLYEVLTYVYNVFESYGQLENQKKVVDLMEYYSSNIDIWKCHSQCNRLKIRYYKQIGDKKQLFHAYDKYYELEQQYHNEHMKQRRSNLLLRKHVFEEAESTKHKIHQLEALSETDMLTGIANRNGLSKYIKEMLPIAVENKKEFGVVLIDIDRYKGYNDHYGHLQGDECLKKISAVLKDVMKDGFCARYGGDEFICVFVGQTKDEILDHMKTLQAQISALQIEHIKNPPYEIVTLSQGGEVHIPVEGEEFEKFVYEADIKLYKSKEKGRNVIIV